MAEYAPAAIFWLFTEVKKRIPKAVNSGIVGDAQHGSGYHRSRNALKAAGKNGDYSIQLAADKAGDGDAASALDIKLDAATMKLVTGRLMKSAHDDGDPRLNVVREFYGTLDGKNVAGWDTFHNRSATSDTSHLWHVHISFLRKHAISKTAMADVLSVIVGDPYGEDDDMSLTDADAQKIAKETWGFKFTSPGLDVDKPRAAWDWAKDSMRYGKAATAELAAVRAELAAAKARDTALLAAVRDDADVAAILGHVDDAVAGLRTSLLADLAPGLVAALRDAVGEGLDDEQLTAAVSTALRQVLGTLDNEV